MLAPMKISIDQIPPKWAERLRKKAAEAGYKSVNDYLRFVIAGLIGAEDEYQAVAWGGRRQVQPEEKQQEDDEGNK